MSQESEVPLLIGAKIRKRREELRLSQVQLAAMAKMEKGNLNRLEKGHTKEPKLTKILAIMRALRMDASCLDEDMDAMNVDTVDCWPLG